MFNCSVYYGYLIDPSLIPLYTSLGRHAGTPLHHAAKRGLEQTVKLLLSHRGITAQTGTFVD